MAPTAARTPRPQLDPTVIAAIHRAGRVWRCLAGRIEGGRLAVSDHREFANDQVPRIQAWLDTQRAGRVIVVVPASAVICRTCPLPSASPEQLMAALQLQAESHLLGQFPQHRTALAVLHEAPGETTRCGLVLAWPESSKVEWPPLDRAVTFAPDMAALAALLDGARPSDPILWTDRRDGSVALAITHANGATFRATREDAADDAAWQANISRVVGETAIGVGHTGSFVEAMVAGLRRRMNAVPRDGSQLLLPEELLPILNPRLAGAARDGGWWADWGIAAGVLLATTDQLALLTRMLDQPPIETPSQLTRMTDFLSRRTTAIRAAIICLAVLALAPLAFSGTRLLILHAKVPDLDAHNRALTKADAQLVMYRDLRDHTWSMSKLLADLACDTPEGIEVQAITMAYGQDLHISGTATKKDQRGAKDSVLLMSEQMRKSGVFDDIRIKWGTTDNFGTRYDFDLFAGVKGPFREVSYSDEQDFGKKSLAKRMYGDKQPGEGTEDSSSTVEGPPATPGPMVAEGHNEEPQPGPAHPDEETDSHPRVSASGSGDAANGPAGIGERPTLAPPSQQVPEHLSQAQIDAMDRNQARDALGKVLLALKRADLSPEDQKRLKDEQQQLMQHMRLPAPVNRDFPTPPRPAQRPTMPTTARPDRPASTRPASAAAPVGAAAMAAPTLRQRLQRLPRAIRWAIYGGATVLLLLVYSDYVLATAGEWNNAAQERQEALEKARVIADSGFKVEQLGKVIETIGPVEMPGDEADSSARLKRAVNEVIKSHKDVTKDSFQTGSPGKLKRGTMQEILGIGEARYVSGAVEFEANVETAMQVISELEGRPEIDSISNLRINRPSSRSELKKVNVRLQVEAWVISTDSGPKGSMR